MAGSMGAEPPPGMYAFTDFPSRNPPAFFLWGIRRQRFTDHHIRHGE